jgi:hypothetical protein
MWLKPALMTVVIAVCVMVASLLPVTYAAQPAPAAADKPYLVEWVYKVKWGHAAFNRDENRRWELVEAHWDLPIREIDPHLADN